MSNEPVAWMVYTQDGQSCYVTDNPADILPNQRALPLYTDPVPTDEALLRQALEAREEARDALYEKKARRVRPGQGVCITGASGSDGNQH